MVEIVTVAGGDLSPVQKAALLQLWNAEYPTTISLNGMPGLEEYLARMVQPTHYFAVQYGVIVGWTALFSRDGQPWFGIIVGRRAQGSGIGHQLLNILKSQSNRLYGWATDTCRYFRNDGSAYPSPVQYYLKHGFTLLNERLETGQLSAVKIVWEANG